MKYSTTLFVTFLVAAGTLYGADIPHSAANVKPIQIKEFIPEVTLRTPNDDPVNLTELVAQKPTVLIFYRGGWCPTCNRHLAQLQKVEARLLAMGYQILAVSPDRPEKIKQTAARGRLNYRLLSDSSMAASRAFGVAFRVNDKTVRKYKEELNIDLEADSGQTHHQLPVPSVFVIDTTGQIIFAHSNPNYKKRLDADILVNTINLLSYRSKKF